MLRDSEFTIAQKIKFYSRPFDWTPADKDIKMEYEQFKRGTSERVIRKEELVEM